MEHTKLSRSIGAEDDDKEYYHQYFDENDRGYFFGILEPLEMMLMIIINEKIIKWLFKTTETTKAINTTVSSINKCPI